jgi:DNA-binding IclR family transcriptional regulator
MALGRFPDYLDKQAWRSTIKVPSHQRLMQALAAAGPTGMTLAHIGGLVGLEYETLTDLLDALTRAGEISVSQAQDGQRLYRRLL